MLPSQFSSHTSCLCFTKNRPLLHNNCSEIHNSAALKKITSKRVDLLVHVLQLPWKYHVHDGIEYITEKRYCQSLLFFIISTFLFYILYIFVFFTHTHTHHAHSQLWTCLVLLGAICAGFHCYICFVFSQFYSCVRAFDVTWGCCVTRTWSLNCSHVSQDCCWSRQGWNAHVITYMSSIWDTLF